MAFDCLPCSRFETVLEIASASKLSGDCLVSMISRDALR
jgi:hypothetical protein